MFFWSIFFKTNKKKVIDRQKRHFGRFWRLITVVLYVLKNTDQNSICVSMVFKAKTKEKYEEIFFTVFISILNNALFRGQPIFIFNSFFSFSF